MFLFLVHQYLYSLVWGRVCRLEVCGFKVIALTCDCASANRKFLKLHKSSKGLTYKTKNPYPNEDRPIFFISDQVTPVGHHTHANTVKWMCSSAGVDGYKTNHSLRVTTATRFAMKCSFVALCLWVFFITPCLFPAYYCDPAVRTTTGEAPDTIRFTPAKLRLTVVCLAATYK